MGIRITQVDAFTDKPFAGNPAAVCILPAPADEHWMQSVASEMNLSETAFLHPEKDGFRLRWFTPAVEVALCGHATIASSHVLWEENHLSPGSRARFYTKSGLLTARKDASWIELDFPSTPAEEVIPPEGLLESLGAKPRFVGKARFDYLLEVESEDALKNLKPNYQKLLELPVRGIIVTAKAASGPYDFVSRFFAPAAGVNEDPVTGSAHCCLGPYWKDRLGKSDFLAYQASARGGVVRVGVRGERVLLGGQARTVLRGELV
jgi:predicted PhzF superfamily epimerase YddE/YHI9